jgi:CDGSH-type Zn-finger protein
MECAPSREDTRSVGPSFRRLGGGGAPARYIAGMSDVTITPKANGPLLVQGPVRIVTPDGRELPVPPRKDGRPAEVVVLCRCGGSATKPFCDGTHKRNGFTDAPPPASQTAGPPTA